MTYGRLWIGSSMARARRCTLTRCSPSCVSGCSVAAFRWRVAVFVRTLHPRIMGRRFVWRPGADVEVSDAPFDLLESAEFRGSPVAKVYASGMPIRRRLADADCPMDFPMLAELRNDGVTDYLASPLLFTDGEIHLATWTTRQPGGFTDAQIKAIESIVAPLARVAEVRALRRTAGNLLDTYVGNNAGERILAGQIRRGHAEAIHAAIWLSRHARLHLVGRLRARAGLGRATQ